MDTSERHNTVSPQGIHDITSADSNEARRIAARGAAVIDGYWVPTARDRLAARALGIVSMAIKRGTIPELAGRWCMDCGAPAECYDHRNYYEPLKVDPVCKGCNNRRGPGFPYPTDADGRGYKSPISGAGIRWSGMEGDADGYIVHELPVHATLDWKELADAVDDSADRLRNATWARTERRVGTLKGWVKTARSEYFKARDPWALADAFEEFS